MLEAAVTTIYIEGEKSVQIIRYNQIAPTDI